MRRILEHLQPVLILLAAAVLAYALWPASEFVVDPWRGENAEKTVVIVSQATSYHPEYREPHPIPMEDR